MRPGAFQPSVIELSASALKHNLRFLQGQLPQGTLFSSVIKGSAYGHGIGVFVPLAESCGVRHFSVSGADEALAAWNSRTEDSELMVMGWLDSAAVEWAVEQGISFWIFDVERARQALGAALRTRKPARVHLEIETGLNRTGLDAGDLDAVLEIVAEHPSRFVIEGLCTHLAGAESAANHQRIERQIESFRRISDALKEKGVAIGRRHVACSAAIFAYPETVLDLVRCGIAQYGFWPSTEIRMRWALGNEPGSPRMGQDALRRVMKWRSQVMAVRDVGPGEFVGYGNSYLTTRRQRIAAVPVGYAHGFARSLSNLGHVLVQGRHAQVVGTVNMSMMLVDVTDLPGVQPGSEVVIIGKQGRLAISVSSFSDLTRNLNYEVLVRIPSEIPRVVVP
ncbi:MAG TPA: alanine racemase [Polyangia bacterium]|nr:alanine racemase [Polyangia bacterium]